MPKAVEIPHRRNRLGQMQSSYWRSWCGLFRTPAFVGGFVPLATLLLYLSLRRSGHLDDLDVYRGAVRAQLHGQGGLYTFHRANGDTFNYPPLAALVLIPFVAIPALLCNVLWQLLSIAALVLVTRVVVTYRRPSAPPVQFWFAATLALVSAPMMSNLRFGQVSIFVFAAVLLGSVCADGKWGGVAIGLAAAIKLTPLLFIPYLLLAGRRRDGTRAIATFIVATLTALVIWPAASIEFWTRHVFGTANIPDVWIAGNQSVEAILARSGMHDIQLTVAWLGAAVLVSVAALIAAKRPAGSGDELAGGIIVGCATVAASPVSWTHHQFWLLAAAVLVVSKRGEVNALWCGTVTALMIVPLPHSHTSPLGWVAENSRGILAVFVVGLILLYPTSTIDAVRRPFNRGSSGSARASPF